MKMVIIIGGTGGIGSATAKKFAESGEWKVVVTGREDLDVTNSESVESFFSKFDQIDCLVNCAGIFGNKTLLEYDLESINKVIAVNEVGTYLCTQAVLSKMTSGSIINISSVAGQVGSGSDPIYAATKGAILAFTKSMAKALAPKIRVNCVAPGVTDTGLLEARKWTDIAFDVDQTPLGKIATPADIANTIYFLASDESGHITGATLDVNGGVLMR
jgi:3-oxoacyl-[acyl-carrier protein] reductase